MYTHNPVKQSNIGQILRLISLTTVFTMFIIHSSPDQIGLVCLSKSGRLSCCRVIGSLAVSYLFIYFLSVLVNTPYV